ncbi:hypothetical protein M422DRAFT_232537 [Sphaerobolus stellatus SS14]|uniref:Pyroglutamyl-peptidase I n=1 Tax=Sphaerobolus stellatus (strain SS14) TaxID=990650 RepID=A0A0C9VFY8_SPHS4|nr:hypothetical protein M422DRAFT_232537 [Sphaerobolus stellatus SS14]
MPSTQITKRKQLNVLITGFGPFAYVKSNPSWECIAGLHNTTLTTAGSSQKIHITCLGPLLVTYSAIISLVPHLHGRPPSYPDLVEILHERTSLDPDIRAPENGWDLILHLGAGFNGGIEVEKAAHKTGYDAADAEKELPPIVGGSSKSVTGMSKKDKLERQRAGQSGKGTSSGATRGYGVAYEEFPEELKTDIDVDDLIAFLKKQLKEERIKPSNDAGHYLCDFIYYGSLAESQRTLFGSSQKEKNMKNRSKILFMHTPYELGQPFSLEELTEIVKQAVGWICTGEGV